MKAVAENPTAPPLMRSNLALKKQTEKQHIAFCSESIFFSFRSCDETKTLLCFFCCLDFFFFIACATACFSPATATAECFWSTRHLVPETGSCRGFSLLAAYIS
jgi:hypothetical protein